MKLRGRHGEYLVGALLGAGGMATVHRGRALHGSRRAVAIKRIHPHLVATDPKMVERFAKEAAFASKLVHPNIVGLIDVVDEGATQALILELIDGGSLLNLSYVSWNRGEVVPRGVASAIVLDVLEALATTHELTEEDGRSAMILHRDVSPHNVLLGKDGVARLADFGIAKPAGATSSTEIGVLKGKLGYMAPELFQKKEVSVASDLYGAGVILWELLASERLFEGEVAEIIGQMMTGDRSRTGLEKRGLSPELAAVVSRMIDPEPDRRFATARIMADALRTALPPADRAEIAAWVSASMLHLPGEHDVAPPSSAAQTTAIERRSFQPPRAGNVRWILGGGAALVVGAGAIWAATRSPSVPSGVAADSSSEASATATDAPPAPSAPEPSATALPDPVASTPAPVASTARPAPVPSSSARAPAKDLDVGKARRQIDNAFSEARKVCFQQSGAFSSGLYRIFYYPSGSVTVTAITSEDPCILGRLSALPGLGQFVGRPHDFIVGGS
ncbi:MAG: serine/threonine protein kinase [Polyangiaceae bacterium]|nr:serine/threonine protein kinase [Polyangiaceae bacterium]